MATDIKCEYGVGDLVQYATKVNFALPNLKLGIVVEVLDIEEFLYTEDREDDREEYYKGFMKEWENYNRIRKLGEGPQHGYPEERERMLERSFGDDKVNVRCLLRVLWNTGVQYIEHPEDLKTYEEEDEREQ